jgi:hypothetical protein
MKDYFLNLEMLLLSREVRASQDIFSKLLDDEFLEYGSSGKIYNKEIILERLPNSEFSQTDISEFSVFEISENFVQTRFLSKEENRISLRTSLWKKYSHDDWKMVFHQGTLVS